jgi:hypothetical protein
MTAEKLIDALRGIQYIVINTCFGGFGISDRAEREYKKKAGITDPDFYPSRDIPRDDPYLVQIVQELGQAANGPHANLKIVEVPAGVNWEIAEYDGNEHVAEKHRTWE